MLFTYHPTVSSVLQGRLEELCSTLVSHIPRAIASLETEMPHLRPAQLEGLVSFLEKEIPIYLQAEEVVTKEEQQILQEVESLSQEVHELESFVRSASLAEDTAEAEETLSTL